MKIVPYSYRKFSYPDATVKLISETPHEATAKEVYEIELYCIFDGKRVYSSFHQADVLEWAAQMDEYPIDYKMFRQRIRVFPGRFDHIYDEIKKWESYVSETNND